MLPALMLGFCMGCAVPDRGYDLSSFSTSNDQRLIAGY